MVYGPMLEEGKLEQFCRQWVECHFNCLGRINAG